MTIVFEHNGVFYEMTEDQIEAAFRYQQNQYRQMDAKRHLDNFIYGGNPDDMSNFECEMEESEFQDRYKMKVEDAYKLLDKMRQRFDKDERCDIDEDTTWENAIWSVLTGN